MSRGYYSHGDAVQTKANTPTDASMYGNLFMNLMALNNEQVNAREERAIKSRETDIRDREGWGYTGIGDSREQATREAAYMLDRKKVGDQRRDSWLRNKGDSYARQLIAETGGITAASQNESYVTDKFFLHDMARARLAPGQRRDGESVEEFAQRSVIMDEIFMKNDGLKDAWSNFSGLLNEATIPINTGNGVISMPWPDALVAARADDETGDHLFKNTRPEFQPILAKKLNRRIHNNQLLPASMTDFYDGHRAEAIRKGTDPDMYIDTMLKHTQKVEKTMREHNLSSVEEAEALLDPQYKHDMEVGLFKGFLYRNYGIEGDRLDQVLKAQESTRDSNGDILIHAERVKAQKAAYQADSQRHIQDLELKTSIATGNAEVAMAEGSAARIVATAEERERLMDRTNQRFTDNLDEAKNLSLVPWFEFGSNQAVWNEPGINRVAWLGDMPWFETVDSHLNLIIDSGTVLQMGIAGSPDIQGVFFGDEAAELDAIESEEKMAQAVMLQFHDFKRTVDLGAGDYPGMIADGFKKIKAAWSGMDPTKRLNGSEEKIVADATGALINAYKAGSNGNFDLAAAKHIEALSLISPRIRRTLQKLKDSKISMVLAGAPEDPALPEFLANRNATLLTGEQIISKLRNAGQPIPEGIDPSKTYKQTGKDTLVVHE